MRLRCRKSWVCSQPQRRSNQQQFTSKCGSDKQTMQPSALRKLLEQVRDGSVTPDDAVSRLRHMPFEDLGFAKIDHHRRLRSGMPEVIFSRGKTPHQVAQIFKKLAAQGGNVLATKADLVHYHAVKKLVRKAEYREGAQAIVLRQDDSNYGKGSIVIVSAGT